MAERFLRLPAEQQRDILNAGAAKLGRDAAVLEKDIWVCWALHHVFGIPRRPRMAFKGGISLSKVFDAIQRFSEDIDITIDYRDLGIHFNPFAKGASKTALKKFGENLRARLNQYAHETVKPHLQAALEADLGKKEKGLVRISDDGEKLWVNYPSCLDTKESYVASSVLIELGARNITEPNARHILRPYLAEISTELDFIEAKTDVLVPERTFWEKATLIHVECNRRELKGNADRLSRHWSDLAGLAKHEIGKRALANRNLMADVVKHKEVFFPASYADYQACLNRGLKLVPDEPLRSALSLDFKKMVDSGMFFGVKPDFVKIIATLTALEKQINA
jgi:hypothetical protein